MYEKGKYVTGEVDGIGCAVCFPEVVPHTSMLPIFNEKWGAGFFHVERDENSPTGLRAVCHGESVGLQIKSSPERDSRLVGRALGLLPG